MEVKDALIALAELSEVSNLFNGVDIEFKGIQAPEKLVLI